jgi:RNase P/RNase MRP subunit p29
VAGSIEMSHTNNNMKFLTGTTERMRIDASGDVFIGTTTSTGNPLTVQADSGAAAIGIKGRVSDGIGTMSLYANDGTTPHGYIQGRSAEFRVWGESGRALLLGAGAAEGARIDTSGNLLVGKTSNTFSTPGFVANANGMSATRSGGACVQINRTSSDGTIQEFYKDGTLVGSISTNANSLPSDRNFKRNIQDLSLGLNFISSLEPVTYNYKIDDDGAPVMAGLIAQDVEIALSAAGVEANSMTLLQHNPTEDEKESDYQLDYLKLVPVLINAVKELTERLEQLENN